ncbi:MAG: biotin/lipoyl-binding protein [Candidatus Nanopelagicales bacterium]|jgi:propionyl-CoA carboxylase alpha chain|nr:biotin/lipoyl-binding protein [Candidatus Nanopelagicales bacterium]
MAPESTPSTPPSAGIRPIRRILVANRGEIARRVIRTAHRMGLQAVAIHSDPDAGAPFVRDADLAVAIGGRTSAESYLVAEKVLDAARRSGADAIHPGYGFLSENPQFARAVADAGLAWIGPTPESMNAMALKVEAKRLVAAAGVPLVPGAELEADASDADITAAGAAVGLPLLVKASAGGGGKGMRLVREPDELLEAVSAARNEAASAFGDPTVFLERYLERGRHVEVQVFGDTHGNVVHAFERECSIQRRHQKVVEESPSPGATPATLERMYAAAVAAARAIDYVGAGTVEFMVAGEGADQEFFFLEMNTRLQVEHPVTEEVTGLDLVEWQVRVAAGEPLPLAQEQVTRSGHAIEVRLYAEDPARGYLPGMGRIECFEADPAPGIRLESGVETGSEVSAFYDPMLAKVIAHGPTREVAAATLATSLEGLRVAGVPTNRESLAAILRSPEFLSGDTTTAFLDENPQVAVPVLERRELAAHLAAAALGLAEQERVGQPWAALAPAGWRNIPAVPEVRRFGYSEFGSDLSIEVRYTRDREGGVDITLAGDGVATGGEAIAVPGPADMRAAAEAALLDEGPEATGAVLEVGLPPLPATLRVDRTRAEGEAVMVEVDGVGGWFTVRRAGDWALVTGLGRTTTLKVLPRHPDASDHGHDHGLVTPVPGTVTAVLVEAGAHVAAGDTLVILEAMKMEHRIKADDDGVVAEVRVAVGDSVDAHHVVAVLEDE